MKSFLQRICLLAAMLLSAESPLPGQQISGRALLVLREQCAGCHSGDAASGNLDLARLSRDLRQAPNRIQWIRIYDRIQQGEMPPADAERNQADLTELISLLKPALHDADRHAILEEGRGPLRRLTRVEYEQTLRDRLQLPDLDVQDLLPEDGRLHGFRRASMALDLSRVQLEGFLNAAQAALAQAEVRIASPPAPFVYQAQGTALFSAADTFGGREAMFFARDDVAVVGDELNDAAATSPLELALFRSAHWPYYGYPKAFRAPATGRYRVQFSARSVLQQSGFRLIPGTDSVAITFRARMESGPDVSGDVRETGGWHDVSPALADYETEILLRAGETFEYSVLGLPVPLARNVDGGPPTYRYPPFPDAGQRGIAIRSLRVDGPLPADVWPPPSHSTLFGEWGPEVWPPPAQQLVEANRLLQRFSEQVCPQPLPDSMKEQLLGLVERTLQAGKSFREAMLQAYVTVLTSAQLLYLPEPGTAANETQQALAVAQRLSHLLTAGPADDELLTLATDGTLLQRTVLLEQTDRLMLAPGFQSFVRDFCNDWLDLEDIRRNEPDQHLYPEYRFDDYLLQSMQRETLAFVSDLFEGNESLQGLIRADYAWVNDRLAQHYGLPSVAGSEMRRVAIPHGNVRGGLLTQAAILRVTSGSRTTSPFIRGAWVMDRLLGQPVPPPPPGAAAVSPDLRGVVGIRKQLQAHLADTSCAVCHSRFDPLGLALENFDVCGGWRERYRDLDIGDLQQGIDRAGHDFAFGFTTDVVAAGRLSDGREFADVPDLQRLLLTDIRSVARGFLHKLTVYGTGTPVRFSERPEIDAILDRCSADGYRAGDLLRELVASRIFCGESILR